MISLSLLVALAGVAASSVRAGDRWTRSLVPSAYVVVSPVDQPAVLAPQFTGQGIRYASPVLFFSAQSGNTLMPLASIEPDVFVRGLDFVEGSAERALPALQAGGAILVPRRLAERRGLTLDSTVELRTVAGPRPFHVAGVVAHSFPSSSGGQSVMVSRADAERLFGRAGFRILMVEPESGVESADMRERLRELAERYGMSATTADGIASDVALAIFRLLALVGTLVAIGLLVAAFGTANTMTMNVTQRARELGILWAAGMSRAQLAAMTVAEATMIGLMGGILGVAVGGVLSWLLVSLARTSGFEPQYVFPFPAAIAALFVAIVAASVAGLIPAWRAARIWTS
jgi:putative ABC transport system permease protein